MDREERAASKQRDEKSEGFVAEEKSLEGYTEEEPVYLEPSSSSGAWRVNRGGGVPTT
jgi:hypothetical protein